MYAGTQLTTTAELAESLLGEDAITRWNSNLQKSEPIITLSEPICMPIMGCIETLGRGADINMEEGFEVSVTQDSFWIQE
ncbi:MAG: hypothetical protein P8X70_03475 [Nanoarchaeota archaeon]